MPRRKEPTIPDAILDQLLAGADPKTAFDPNGLLYELKKALAERALNAEIAHHLAGDGGAGNGQKTVIWLRVMNQLKYRGVEDILIAVVESLKGFPDAINAAFPETTVQNCIVVHLLRQSLDFVSYKTASRSRQP